MSHALLAFGWVDWALLAVLLLSLCVGLWRGLVFEVLSLLGWVAAYLLAQAFTADAAPHVPLGAPGTPMNLAVTFVVLFMLALIAWTLSARLVRLLINATPLRLIDRVLGAGFGLLRGLLVLLVITTVVLMTPAARSTAWRSSPAADRLTALLHDLKPMLPSSLAQHLPA
jgi:membrane protein required for colicin V production